MYFVILLSLICSGIYYEYQSCVLSVALLLLLWREVKRNKEFRWKKNYLAFFFPALPLLYLLSTIWAVDSQMALLGFLKYLPIGIFSVLIMQMSQMRQQILDVLPLAGVELVLLSAAGSLVPGLSEYLVVNGRLAGTFQYPNTFALFLLIALLYLLHQKRFNKKCVAQALVLLAGILATGSRTVYLLLPISLLAGCLFTKEKAIRKAYLSMFAVLVVCAVVVLLVTNGSPVARIMNISLSESTLLGRILYWKDALPVIAKNPLGLGYLGYYFTQGSFQTGVYAVTHAHNEFVQLFLDVGWIGGAGFAAAMIYSIKKTSAGWKRLLIIVMVLHALMDFDLQYMAVYMVLLSLLPWENGREWDMKYSKLLPAAALCLAAVVVYGGLGNAAYYFGQQNFAQAFYPKNTLLQIVGLKQAADMDEMESIANEITRQNDSVALAWDAKARSAFAQGDVLAMMEYKEKTISLSKYEIAEYTDYLDMLFMAIQMYQEAGDMDSATYCAETAVNIPLRLEAVREQTSSLGWKVQDKPELALPKEYKEVIDLLKDEYRK
ncbi:O-antigen ligase family protein [Emergencia sp.]|uniref:O-antigen ligase family protein n=1 Tax=Emergencia sp. TaxID=1926557 RepID=UPI003AF1C277